MFGFRLQPFVPLLYYISDIFDKKKDNRVISSFLSSQTIIVLYF